jgi:hypothetical protein
MNHNCPVCGTNLKWRILGKQCPKCESLLESNDHSEEKKIIKICFIPMLALGLPIFIVRIFAGRIAFTQNLMGLWILIQLGSLFFAFQIYKRIPKNWARYCSPKHKRE